MNTGDIVLLHVAATLVMVGVIWFVQLVHYPLFSSVGEGSFTDYQQLHMSRTGLVVVPAMLVEAGTAVLLVLLLGPGPLRTYAYVGAGVLVIIWISTFFIQVPAHEKLVRGFSEAVHYSLVETNWIRTLGWSCRGLLVLFMLREMFHHALPD